MLSKRHYYTRFISWIIRPVIAPLFDEVVTAIDQLRERKIDWEEVNVLMDGKLQSKK